MNETSATGDASASDGGTLLAGQDQEQTLPEDAESGSPTDTADAESSGQPTDGGEQNQTAEGESEPIAGFELSYDVPLISQPDAMTCWAAAIAMIRSYRDQASYGVDDVAGSAPHAWMHWAQIEPIATNLGFAEIAPADYEPGGWHDMLTVHGPLWIVVKAAVSNTASHAVVLIGISGDGSLDATQMISNNPSGSVDTQPFRDFANRWDFGAVAGASIFAAT